MALEDLVRYESAAVAATNLENEKDISLIAMQSLYKTILGKDYDDPVYQRAFGEAQEGLKTGAGITNLGIAQAIQTYNQKYEKAFVSTKISDITKYLIESYKVSDEVKKALGTYSDLTIADIAEKLKVKEISKEDKESFGKVVQAIEMLKDRRLRAKTLDIYNNVVKQNLDSLYPKKEEDKKA
jgi:hypothetical protein